MTPAAPHAAAPADALQGTILIVDDELPNRMVFRKLLQGAGCSVLEAADGETGLAAAREARPDLILVDVLMPGISGFEVCTRLKRDPVTAEIPVLMVTAETKIESIEQGFLSGAADYIRKPVNPRELLMRVRTNLALKRTTDDLRHWQDRMKHELEMAGALQKTLLSTRPVVTRQIEARFVYQACLDVGGDVFDLLTLPDGRVCVYVGDVCGHGVAQALISSLIKASMAELIRNYAHLGPAAVCNEMDERFRSVFSNPSLYATLFLAIFDPERRVWRAMNCGHPAPLFLDPAGVDRSELFDAGGSIPLGFALSDGSGYATSDEATVETPPGSLLLFFTDGLIEARDAAENELGREGLLVTLRAVRENPSSPNPAADLHHRLRDGGFAMTDDCTAVALDIIDPSGIARRGEDWVTHEGAANIARQIEASFAARGWPAETTAALELLTLEHLSNVVDHGHCAARSMFWYQARDLGDRARLVFRDEGMEWDFDGNLAARRRQPVDSERGRGLAIIDRIAGAVEIIRRDNANLVVYTVPRQLEAGKLYGEEAGAAPR